MGYDLFQLSLMHFRQIITKKPEENQYKELEMDKSEVEQQNIYIKNLRIDGNDSTIYNI